MVLDESSTSSSSDFSSDSSPTSDIDPYNADSSYGVSGRQTFQINLENAPRPWLGSLFGYNDEVRNKTIALRIASTSQRLRRPLTQEECQAYGEHVARTIALAGNLAPIGPALGLGRAYRTRSTYRFPLYQPKSERFNPSKFAFLEGQMARTAWQAVRYSMYGAIGFFLGSIVVDSYTITTMAAHEARDPRLRQVNMELRKNLLEQYQERMSNRRQGNGRSVGGTTTGYAGDEASPTTSGLGGYGEDGGPVAGRDGNDGMLTDQEMRSRERRQQASPRNSPTSNVSSTFDLDKVARQPTGFDDTFDDASPTMRQMPSSGSADGSGSTWERVRRQANTPTSSSSPTRPSSSSYPSSSPSSFPPQSIPFPPSSDNPSSSSSDSSIWAQRRQNAMESGQGGDQYGSSPSSSPRRGYNSGVGSGVDSFSFSKTDEERQLARAEAQRAFDEQVEQERRGGRD